MQVLQSQRRADTTTALAVAARAADDTRRADGAEAPGPACPDQTEPAFRAGGQIVVIPAHGGAGASTLTGWLTRELTALSAGHGWHVSATPALPDADPARIAASAWLRVPPPAVPVIIAARGNAEGARRAVIAVTALEHRGIWPAAIAVVADGAGPEPRQVAQYLSLIGSRAGPAIRVPFVSALRSGTGAADVPVRRRLRDAMRRLLALAVPVAARAGGQP